MANTKKQMKRKRSCIETYNDSQVVEPGGSEDKIENNDENWVEENRNEA